MQIKCIYLLSFIVLAGCSPSENISSIAMPPPLDEEGPFQLITYDGSRIEKHVFILDGKQIIALPKAVYMDRNGRIVFKDSSPIKTFNGHDIYWNEQGIFISSVGEILSKRNLFTIGGKPMEKSDTIMFKDIELIAKSKANNQ